MEPEFNVDQVFQIAGRIQQNAADFYQEMAKRFSDFRLRGLCSVLADQRAEQAKVLEEERKRFCDKYGFQVTYGYRDYIASHPSEMADLAIFSHDRYHSVPLTGRESREEIFKDAIERSKAIIVFLQGLKEFAQDAVTERALDKIIIIERESRYKDVFKAHIPQTIVVRADGTGDYPTIQAAIDAALNGDTIIVEA